MMTKWIGLCMLLWFQNPGGPPVKKPRPASIPEQALKNATKTADVHGVIWWLDNSNLLHKDRLNTSDINALKAGRIKEPPIPNGFNGTLPEWQVLWSAGRAWVGGGRPTWNTTSGEPAAGYAELKSGGRVWIYSGDMDLAPIMVLEQDEYVGPFPNITLKQQTRCGIRIVGGMISGTPDVECINSGHRVP